MPTSELPNQELRIPFYLNIEIVVQKDTEGYQAYLSPEDAFQQPIIGIGYNIDEAIGNLISTLHKENSNASNSTKAPTSVQSDRRGQ